MSQNEIISAVVELEVYIGLCTEHIIGKLACDVVVAYCGLGYVVQVNVAEDTAHAEHVLTLETSSV